MFQCFDICSLVRFTNIIDLITITDFIYGNMVMYFWITCVRYSSERDQYGKRYADIKMVLWKYKNGII